MPGRSIVRTDALVLRRLAYGETSAIVTLFTRERGKVAVMARGARRPKSPYGASLQPMAHAEVVFYHKPTRTLQTLSESSLVEPLHRISDALEPITLGLQVMELLDQLLEDEDPQPPVLNIAIDILRALHRGGPRLANVWPFAQLRLSGAMGVAPAVTRASITAITDDRGWLSLANGNVYPLDGRPRAGTKASREALRAFAVFARAALADVLRMRLAPDVRAEVGQLIDDYLRYHFEDAYRLKSRAVIQQLRAPQ
ncbi:DNA repair protein RecO [Salisaeta longa]|uniref:DNA repair protein RecO n=1 Tax=Salisaeta longa TaxID=503170 RepID=UPI0003B698E8|nr:DNA repair protein RecO [Salisaeta longa]